MGDQTYHQDCVAFAQALRDRACTVSISALMHFELLNGLTNLFVRGSWEEYKRRSRDPVIRLAEFKEANPGLIKTLFQSIETGQRAANMLLRSSQGLRY